ncbi:MULTISPECIES: DUF3566 domain-containing protein [Kitasatospora]|uniref:DUF3566 domain-containing protein n=1 Tax=Kitasatospora TaxID=2063 RepID=UPI000C71532C|nr:DUF3566 domain-containing protein [Kitasatospora sp. GP30]
MSAVGSTGGYSGGASGKPTVPAPPAQPAPGTGGYSQPTTYTKGEPASARGNRAPGGSGGSGGSGGGQSGQAARRPAAAAPSSTGSGRVRKARLRVLKADPWSVMKVSFLLSLALGIIMIVAAIVLWTTLDTLGVFDSIGKTLKEVTGSGSTGTGGVNIMDYVGFGQVLTWTVLIAVIDVVLLTALSTLAAFIYNSAAGFTGGVELTLAEEE